MPMNQATPSFKHAHLMQTHAREQILTSPGIQRVLAVGAKCKWEDRSVSLLHARQFIHADFEAVSEELLSKACPQMVLSMVLDDGFDCFDLAKRLEEIGFSGVYRVLAFDLPAPGMIRREISQACPKLDFELISGI